jgi:hypothetical protein
MEGVRWVTAMLSIMVCILLTVPRALAIEVAARDSPSPKISDAARGAGSGLSGSLAFEQGLLRTSWIADFV